MSDAVYLLLGGFLMLVPVCKHVVTEANKPKEITRIEKYNERDELIEVKVYYNGEFDQ